MTRALLEHAHAALLLSGSPIAADKKSLIDALKALTAALAQPEQEPYAWHYYNSGGYSGYHRGPSKQFDADVEASEMYPRTHHLIPLYTAPMNSEIAGLKCDLRYARCERDEWKRLYETAPTAPDAEQLRYEYQQAYLMYSGVPLTFEAWVRTKPIAAMIGGAK